MLKIVIWTIFVRFKHDLERLPRKIIIALLSYFVAARLKKV